MLQLEKFLKLDQKGAVIAEYVWIDSSNGTRSKCKVRPVFPLAYLSLNSGMYECCTRLSVVHATIAIFHLSIFCCVDLVVISFAVTC